MANYQSSYTGAQIDTAIANVNAYGNRITTLENTTSTDTNRITALENSALTYTNRVNITMSMCNTTYISNCGGFYEIWGPFVLVQICLRSVSGGIPASTQCTLMNAGTWPIPEDNTDSSGGAGYASLACQRGPLPYIANNGELRISANGPAVGANSTMFIQGIYRRKLT